ncbi:MAG: hypothetical protein COC01_00530 [Bacteroidetes bacterium]|nr:gliding motility-associated C-terminal domain-containing protein [Bacteroidia bacterium]MBN4052365.1 gliding motility-associated C-terminal domain-containing protein [Sphingobacteriaceae bacterium AH-315-L07]PCH69820.1 MAG: hypothetical protein COC01_00530 [Bacteroidota bacterium]
MIRKAILFTLSYLLIIYNAFCGSTDLRCASTNDNGTVTITWMSGGDQLYIYRNSTGTYQLIDSILNVATTTYTDNNINVFNTPNTFYYLQNLSNASQLSDSLQVMQLNVSNAISGLADLLWNTNHLPSLASSDSYYTVQRAYPKGVWKAIDPVNISGYQDTYIDTIDICTIDSIFYRIELKDNSGCNAYSSVKGNVFDDKSNPNKPEIDSVSVDANGNLIIGWTPNTNDDTYGYIIYQSYGFFSIPKDTIFNKDTSFYLYSGLNTADTSVIFQMAALDTCGNTSIISDPKHNNIYLRYRLDRCDKQVILTWNQYTGWPLSGYDLYYSLNGNALSILTNSTDISSDTLNYTLTDLNDGDSLFFFVRAFSDDKSMSSSSNRVSFVADIINTPDSTYLKRVTVVDQNSVKLTWLVDQTADIKYYHILRGTSPTRFDTIARLKSKKQATMSYTDQLASTNSKSYYYKLAVEDSCSKTLFLSNIGRTVFLDIEANLDESAELDVFEQNNLYNSVNKLKWNQYEGWSGDVDFYNLYRSVDGGVYELLETLPYGTTTYDDDIGEFYETDGYFCYYLEVVENGLANLFNIQDTSLSNGSCIYQIPRLFMPNAFNPGGQVNGVFKPITVFEDASKYLFQIYDRWGTLLFESKDPTKGWDGTYKGRMLGTSAYVYYLNFTGTNGHIVGKKGQVYLIR